MRRSPLRPTFTSRALLLPSPTPLLPLSMPPQLLTPPSMLQLPLSTPLLPHTLMLQLPLSTPLPPLTLTLATLLEFSPPPPSRPSKPIVRFTASKKTDYILLRYLTQQPMNHCHK